MTQEKKYSLQNWLFLTLGLVGLCVMLLWQSEYLGVPGLNKAPFIWFSGGALTSIALFIFLMVPPTKTLGGSFPTIKKVIGLSLLVGSFIALSISLHKLFLEFPIDAAQSDIIPSLQVYVQRFLSGEKVYVAIPFSNYEVWPTYFPAMWLPYVIPEVLGVDYRWMPLFSFFIAYGFILWKVIDGASNWFQIIVLSLAPYIILDLIKTYDESVFAFSTELMPITFYLLLCFGLFRKNLVLIGIMLGLCTMSRYAYTLWIIPFIALIWYEEGFKKLFKVGWIGLSVIFILYVLPFLAFDPAILTDGLKYYGKTADDQWKVQYWQEEGSIPYHLGRGLSFSHWIYKEVEGDYLDKVAFAKNLHKGVSFLTALLLIGCYFIFRKRWKWEKYLMVGLFGYLVVFYGFFYVPFSYLYMLPLFVGLISWVMLSSELKLKSVNKNT